MSRPIVRKIGTAILAFATIASLVFGIYTWLYEKKPRIDIEIVGNIDVLEINRNIDNLKILYDNNDLQKENKKLNVLKFRVRNSGDADILQSMYDVTNQLGISISNAKLVKVTFIASSTPYIAKNIGLQNSGDTVIFNKVIFEKNDFFEFEVLLLFDRNLVPGFTFLGKIAGIDTESVHVKPLVPRESLGFWESVFIGGPSIQLVKTAVYFGIAVAVILIIVSLVGFSSEFLSSVRRSFRKRKFERLVSEDEPKYSSIKANYVSDGLSGLEMTYRLVNDKELLRRRLLHRRIYPRELAKLEAERQMQLFDYESDPRYYDPLIRHLLKDKVLAINGDSIEVDQNYSSEVSKVIGLLK